MKLGVQHVEAEAEEGRGAERLLALELCGLDRGREVQAVVRVPLQHDRIERGTDVQEVGVELELVVEQHGEVGVHDGLEDHLAEVGHQMRLERQDGEHGGVGECVGVQQRRAVETREDQHVGRLEEHVGPHAEPADQAEEALVDGRDQRDDEGLDGEQHVLHVAAEEHGDRDGGERECKAVVYPRDERPLEVGLEHTRGDGVQQAHDERPARPVDERVGREREQQTRDAARGHGEEQHRELHDVGRRRLVLGVRKVHVQWHEPELQPLDHDGGAHDVALEAIDHQQVLDEAHDPAGDGDHERQRVKVQLPARAASVVHEQHHAGAGDARRVDHHGDQVVVVGEQERRRQTADHGHERQKPRLAAERADEARQRQQHKEPNHAELGRRRLLLVAA